MKKLFYLLMVLILASCGNEKTTSISSDTSKEISGTKITAQSIISQMEKGKYKEGELLVKFKSGVVTTSSLKIHQAVGASVKKRFTIVPNLERVKLPQGLSVKDAIMQYMSDPNVEYAEPNYIKRALSRIPNDTYFGNQWALHNTGTYAGGTVDADIDAPEAWDISTGSYSVVIAVLDTGIDYNHADLAGNIWTNNKEAIGDANGDGCPGICEVDDDGDGKVDEDSTGLQPGEAGYTNDLEDDDDENGFIDDCKGWDFTTCEEFDDEGNCTTSKSPDNDPMDEYGHGTHVAGIIGAVGNNGTGVSGVMWYVKLMALKFLNADGYGTTDDEIEALDYAILLKNSGIDIKAINASFGGYGYSQAEYDTIAEANTAGILLIAAAGNEGYNNDLTPMYPASYDLPNIISVAATDQNDQRASFSNFGPTSVDVAAPGVYILSTILLNEYGILEFFEGTSMAAPHVSGLAGLLYSYYDGIHNTQFDYSQIRTAILRMVDPLPTLSGWIQTGGRINAYKALSFLRTPTNLTATGISPTQISLTWSDNATGEGGYKIERKISGGTYTDIQPSLPPNSLSFTDSGLTPNTIYVYRIKAYNDIAESFYSTEVSTTTPLPESGHSGGGGSCSIGPRQNTPTAIADLAVMMIPLVVIALMRRRR
ncbi:MAG: S8 family serine peptidase [Nitrospirota bacterium]